jgi:glutamine amidotransferase
MFGFRSAVPSRAHRSLVEAENALADQSMHHPDGWGIGWFVDGGAYVIKSDNAAHASERFRRASHRLMSHTFIVHVRRATVGEVDHLNAHPFRYGRWLFAHNGTVFGFEHLRDWMLADTDPAFHPLVLGDTDSEHLFYWLITRLDRAGINRNGQGASDAHLVASTIRTALIALDRRAIDLGLERPILNVLLTDGSILIGHKAGMPLFLSSQKSFCADFDTCPATKYCMETARPTDGQVNHLLLASEPIAKDENRWEELPDGTTVALCNDMRVRITPPPSDWLAPVLPERFRLPT